MRLRNCVFQILRIRLKFEDQHVRLQSGTEKGTEDRGDQRLKTQYIMIRTEFPFQPTGKSV